MSYARVLAAGLGLLVVVSLLVVSVLLTETAMLCLPFAFFPNLIHSALQLRMSCAGVLVFVAGYFVFVCILRESVLVVVNGSLRLTV